MDRVPITQARVKELKIEAKYLSRIGGGAFQVLLEQAARRTGFHHWHHLTLSAKHTGDARAAPPRPPSLSVAQVSELVESGEFPFAIDANSTAFFFREADPALRYDGQMSIVTLAAKLGLGSLEDLKRILIEAKPWSRAYFKALADASASSRWRSETDFLFLLVLLGAQAEHIALADLVDLGWGKSLALETLEAARDFRRKLH